MQQHFNIQIHMQRVAKPEQPVPGKMYQSPAELKSAPTVAAVREVTDLVNLSVTAETQEEAYALTLRLLETMKAGGE